ncbi:MAG: TlyA family RNA methyltransferase [Pseudomonadota bacterium]
MRLDEWLVDKGYYPSRSRARDGVLRGCVSINGGFIKKPSKTVAATDQVQIDDPAVKFVSRAALKLVQALEVSGLDCTDKIALDIGSSTGGFCQVLLQQKCSHVYGIDVGHGQIAPELQSHERLTMIEGLNARDLTLDHLEGCRPQIITCDVSFISLKLALPPALQIAEENAVGIFLIKPQFEVGKDGLGKGGIIRDETVALQTANNLKNWLNGIHGWQVTSLLASPISGSDGNQEFLMVGHKHG